MATVPALHRPIRHHHPRPRCARAWAVALTRLWRPSPCATMSHLSTNPGLTVPALSPRARRLTRTSAMPTEHIRPPAQMRWVQCSVEAQPLNCNLYNYTEYRQLILLLSYFTYTDELLLSDSFSNCSGIEVMWENVPLILFWHNIS